MTTKSQYGTDYFGGGVWSYYPDSMLIRLPLTPKELREFQLPDVLGAEKSLTNRELFAGTTSKSKLFFARCKHELDHLVRLLSTSIGLFTHQLDSQLPDQFRWIVEETDKAFFDRYEPLISASDLSEEELQSTRTDRHAAVRLWYRTESLRNGLFDSFESESQYIAALTMLNWFREGQTTVEVEADWPPTPKFGSERLPTTISGRNILEFFAVLKEMDYSASLADEQQPWQDLLLDEDYNAVMRLWSLAFPDGNLWDVSQEGRLDRDLAFFVRRAYPMELYASLDIALWPPLVPTGVMIGERKWSWKDIHPGHRFVRICEWLQRTKYPLSRIAGEERNKDFTDFQKQVCDAHGWPTPEHLAEIWLSDNGKKRRGEDRECNRLMGISFERAGHSRLEMVDRLLRNRLKFPSDLVIGNFTEPQLGVSQLGWISRNENGKLQITETENCTWDISPSILRMVNMTCRFLLLGKRYRGDQPSKFDDQSMTDAHYVISSLLRSNQQQFSDWASSTYV